MAKGRCDHVLLFLRHLREEWQDHTLVLSPLAFRKVGTTSTGLTPATRAAPSLGVAVGRLKMSAHDSTASCNAIVEHSLHHGALTCALRQAYAVALPIRARPVRFRGTNEPRDVG